MRSALPALLIFFLFGRSAVCSTINLYDRVTDPRAITRLTGVDCAPLKCSAGTADTGKRDPIDGFEILARDSGAGIITHIWNTTQDFSNPNAGFKLWIDDQLVDSAILQNFFNTRNGALHPPLDTIVSGGFDCDVQIPYHKNFRITYDQSNASCCIFWNVEWRPVADSALIEKFSLTPTSTTISEQQAAEAALWKSSPWLNEQTKTIQCDTSVPANGSVVVGDIIGPGLIQQVRFVPASFDSASLRALWLRINWDGDPQPAVDVPLADFFGAFNFVNAIRAFAFHTDSASGFLSQLPMPFAVHAQIALVNKSTSANTIHTEIIYDSENVDRTTTGYFAAQFSESNPTHYHIYHQVAHAYGRGKYIGVVMSLPPKQEPWFLEGDPIFEIDSNAKNFIRYTGAEDYCDGGFYFDNGPFTLPFAGCPSLWNLLYRFHYLDAYDFTSSFNFKWQTGVNNDVPTRLRSVAFLYQQWNPFWVDRDTIQAGEQWSIGGSGYAPNSGVTAALGTFHAFTAAADSSGAFHLIINVSNAWTPGNYFFQINGDTLPRLITLASRAAIRFIKDSVPNALVYNDSLLMFGTGFKQGESVKIFFDSVQAVGTLTADSLYQCYGLVRIPNLDSGAHHVFAEGNMGTLATADSLLFTTRLLDYEFENLMPATTTDCIAGIEYLDYTPDYWSNSEIVTALPNDSGATVQFQFAVPLADTFQLNLFAMQGPMYGGYKIFLDSVFVADENFYLRNDSGNAYRKGPFGLGTHALQAGAHVMQFLCTGKDTASAGFELGVDNFLLTPTTRYRVIDVQQKSETEIPRDKFLLYPNPIANRVLNIALPENNFDNAVDIFSVELFDLLGRAIIPEQISRSEYSLQLKLPLLDEGIYFCRMQSASSIATNFMQPFYVIK